MGKYLEDKELDSVLESYFNEGIKDIFKKKNNKKDDDFEWSDQMIRRICNDLKEWLNHPKNLSIQKAQEIFTIATVLNMQSQIEKKYKTISDNSNEYNWDKVVKLIYMDRNVDDPITESQYKELGLNNFPEAKNEKLLLKVFEDGEEMYISFMSKKTGKIIVYDWKNRYNINSFKYIMDLNSDKNVIDTRKDKIKEIWKEIN